MDAAQIREALDTGAPIGVSDLRQLLDTIDQREVVDDAVNHPGHYNAHPSGVECITITEHMNFCLGNAIKYIWRADLKADSIEDLRKAAWYIQREIQRRSAHGEVA